MTQATGAWSQEHREREHDLLALLASAREDASQSPRYEQARDELVLMHMGLVNHVARRMCAGRQPDADLVQAGTIGLITAIDRYDPTHGTQLSTFAVPHIRGEMREALRSNAWSVSVPRHLKDVHATVSATIARMRAEGKSPTVTQVAAELDISEDEVLQALELDTVRVTASIDEPATDDGTSYAEVLGSDDAALARIELQHTMRRVIDRLDEPDRSIVIARFFDNKPQDRIAAELGLSQPTVSRALTRALTRMRAELVE